MNFMKSAIILLSFFVFILTSCQKESITVKPESTDLIGTWINPQYSETEITFDRSTDLPEKNYGITLMSEGKLIERKNIGWCGTPPISYSDYEGNWTENDSIIQINVGYWGGEAKLMWKVLSIDNSHLSVQILSEDYLQAPR